MSDFNEHEHDERCILKLDGSEGLGMKAHLTIVTKDEQSLDGSNKRETYEIPYCLINRDNLIKAQDIGLILGYEVVKLPLETPGV